MSLFILILSYLPKSTVFFREVMPVILSYSLSGFSGLSSELTDPCFVGGWGLPGGGGGGAGPGRRWEFRSQGRACSGRSCRSPTPKLPPRPPSLPWFQLPGAARGVMAAIASSPRPSSAPELPSYLRAPPLDIGGGRERPNVDPPVVRRQLIS